MRDCNFKRAMAIMCMTAALTSASCAVASTDSESIYTESSEAQTTQTEASQADDTQTADEDAQETTTTTAETTTTTTTTTAAPEAISSNAFDSRSFYSESFTDEVYSNDELIAAFDEIDSICSQYGSTISFVYKNFETEATCTYNSTKSYSTCSTVKAPFCKCLLESGIDLEEEITTTVTWSNDYNTTASEGIGVAHTAEELITRAVNQSDNTAYYNLVKYYGYSDFNSMNEALGVSYRLGSTWIFTKCTADDLALQYEDIYNYAEETDRGKWLIGLMNETDLEVQISAQLGDKYFVAHKYGTDRTQYCYHDCAIVYADSPFMLIIMTSQYGETDESNEVFKRLAEQFDIVNSQLVIDEAQE